MPNGARPIVLYWNKLIVCTRMESELYNISLNLWASEQNCTEGELRNCMISQFLDFKSLNILLGILKEDQPFQVLSQIILSTFFFDSKLVG